jgi:hypothetical protein
MTHIAAVVYLNMGTKYSILALTAAIPITVGEVAKLSVDDDHFVESVAVGYGHIEVGVVVSGRAPRSSTYIAVVEDGVIVIVVGIGWCRSKAARRKID